MVTALDTELRSDAAEAISEVGVQVTLSEAYGEGGTFNVTTGRYTDTVPVPQQVLTASPPINVTKDQAEIYESVVISDWSFYFAASTVDAGSVEPAKGGQILHGSDRYEILHINKIYSGDLVAVYEVFARS